MSIYNHLLDGKIIVIMFMNFMNGFMGVDMSGDSIIQGWPNMINRKNEGKSSELPNPKILDTLKGRPATKKKHLLSS